MTRTLRILVYLLIFVFILAYGSQTVANDNHNYNPFAAAEHKQFNLSESFNLFKSAPEKNQAAQQLLLVKLTGTGTAFNMAVPGLEGEALCFDLDLLDLRSNQIIGTATDCFSEIQPDGMGGVGFVGTSFLNFPDGTIVTRGEVSVQPVVRETILRTGQPITHITGSATTGNTFLEGTGIYQNRSGNTRISGMVDATNFTFAVGEQLFFDCIFEIEVDVAD